MASPVFTQISPDDLKWTYEADPIEYTACKLDPTTWFNDNIKRRDPRASCDNPGGNSFIDSRRQGEGKTLLMGLCGTPTIIGNGYNGKMLAMFVGFHQNNVRLVEEGKSPLNYREFMQLTMSSPNASLSLKPLEDPSTFWEKLDEYLVTYGKPGEPIVVAVDEPSRTGSVHIELGHNVLFYFAVHAGASIDPKGYVKWLTKPSTRLITRTAIFTDALGNPVSIDLHPDSVIGANDLVTDPIFVSNTCPSPGYCYSACNVDSGDVANYNAGNGTVNMELDVIVIKPYCIPNPTGGPCP